MAMSVEGRFDFAKLRAIPKDVLPAAIQEGVEHIAEVSAAQTPIEEGTLVRSQRVETDAESLTGSIHYDGPYARRQHEDLTYKHPHGNAKFLEGPLHSEKDKALEIIAHRIKEAL